MNSSILEQHVWKGYLSHMRTVKAQASLHICTVSPTPSLFAHIIWAASSEFGTYRICEQRRFRWACASAQSRQNLRCSLIQAVSQEEPSDRKPDPWPLWMAGHAQLKFVMTECSKTQICLTGLIYGTTVEEASGKRSQLLSYWVAAHACLKELKLHNAKAPFLMHLLIVLLHSFQQLLSNISIVWRIVSLPILEPLTVKRLEKIITITMGCLYASVAVATSNTVIGLASSTPTKGTSAAGKEEDTDSYAANIVQKTVSCCIKLHKKMTNFELGTTRPAKRHACSKDSDQLGHPRSVIRVP